MARNVKVPVSIFHHDEKLDGAGFDVMLPPVQRTTVKHCVPRRVIHDAPPDEMVSNDGPKRHGFDSGEAAPARGLCPSS